MLSGLVPGDYYLLVTTDGEDVSPLYHSGTSDPYGATPIRVTAGSELRGIDVPWRPVPLVEISGRLEGVPPGGAAHLILVGTDGAVIDTTQVALGDPEERDFVLVAPPNRAYELMAFTGGEPPTAYAFQGRSFGLAPIYVGQSGVENVVVTLRAPLELRGQFSWESIPPVGFDGWDDVRLTLSYDSTIGQGGLPLFTASDGSIHIESLSPLRYSISVGGLPAGTYVESARYGATDALVGHFDPGANPAATLQLRVGNQPAEVTGRVVDAGAAYGGAIVTLVPDDDRRSRFDLYRRALSDSDGSFRFETVPPGIYRVWAWVSLPDGAIESGEFRSLFEAQGVRLFADRLGTTNVEVSLVTETTDYWN